jgi:hypothetical protein
MSNWIDIYLGENSLSKIERSEEMKKNVLAIAQKADGINLEQVPEEVFALSQEIFKSLNEISGRDIKLNKESLQKQVSQSAKVSPLSLALKESADLKEMFSKPLSPEPKRRKIVSAIFEIYLQRIGKTISNGPEYDDGNYWYALGALQESLIDPWLGLKPGALYET